MAAGVLARVLAAAAAHAAAPSPCDRQGCDGDGNTIEVDAADVAVAGVPAEMNGAGCGIEFIEHQIVGGLYSQMLVGESFEEPRNRSTGISALWAAGGAPSGGRWDLLTRDTGPAAPVNGAQYLSLAPQAAGAPVWAANRGVGFAGLSFAAGRGYEGWLLMGTDGTRAAVTAELHCGRAAPAVLASQRFAVRTAPGAWELYNITGLTPSAGCAGDGAFAVAAHTPGAPVRIDMAFLQPGAWGRYKGLPVRADLAEFLLASGIAGMRMGGGSINARATTAGAPLPSTAPEGSGYLLANFRGPRHLRQPITGTEHPYASAGWGWVDFADFCEAAGITAAITVSERDDPVAVVEYLFGPGATPGGRLRAGDGHPAPYDAARVILEVGNERMPGRRPECPGDDCVAAFFAFAEAAQRRAAGLGVRGLRIAVCLFAWGMFDPDDGAQRAIVQRAARAGLDLVWDQHVQGMDPNAPYHHRPAPPGVNTGGPRFDSFSYGFYQMGAVTQRWQAAALNRDAAGVRTVVFEENGEPGWVQGANIHDLARGLGHAQNVLAFQRVVAPDGRSPQVLFAAQADCLQAWGQNHPYPCDAAARKDHCNVWDQGTVFFDNRGRVWGQPNYWAGRMLAGSHHPLLVRTALRYNSSFPSQPLGSPAVPAEYRAPVALDVGAMRSAAGDALSVRVVNPTPRAVAARVRVAGLRAAAVRAEVLTSRARSDDNPPGDPLRVAPRAMDVAIADGGQSTTGVVFPPNSLTVLRFSAAAADAR